MHIIWWNLSSFWQLGSAQIIGVQFNRQNLNYFGLSATPFSLDTVSPGWRSDNCPQVEEYALVYASREDLEIFGSSEIGLLSRFCGLGCALPCDPVSSIWAGMQRNVYRKTPGERQESLTPSSFYRSWPLYLWVSWSVFSGQCWWAPHGPNTGHQDMSLRGVNIMMHQPHSAVDRMVSPRLSFPHFPALTRVSSCHCSSLARTWSWCRPKKEDWLKKKDRYQRRPGSRRKKSESTGWAPVLGPSGAACRSRWAPVLGPALTCSVIHCHLELL